MPDLELDETEQDEQIQEDSQESAPEEQTEETNEEIEQETPVQEQQDQLAPTVVERIFPHIAGHWGNLGEDARQAILDDVAARLDKGEITGDTDKEGQSRELDQSEQTGDSPKSAATPGVITDADLKALKEFYEGEPILGVIEKLVGSANYAVNRVQDIGETALRAIDEHGKDISSIRDETALSKALRIHRKDLRGMDERRIDAMVNEAIQIKKSGRTDNWTDAVSLSLLKQTKPKSDNPDASLKQKAREVAASLATSGRSPREAARAKGKTIREIGEMHARKLGITLD